MRTLTTIALILLIVGGLNWLAVGAAQTDLVALLFGGQDSPLARIVYVLVGISALIVLFALPRLVSDHRDHLGVPPVHRP
ncbi:DUF378 domain-containing protein [Tabrizicola sp.]|uniref:DUF378 domain-containing protein n=1 Tax=Tabrizicola sp. TaxID=2005166 RepID=UPI0025E20461|nr:DUF378 domain-containing protein [Tabrizicola sp.]